MTAAPIPRRIHARALLALGLPLAGSHVAQVLVHATDLVFLGWYAVDALAAAVLAAVVIFLLFMLGSGFGLAVMPLAAGALARGDVTRLRRDARMGIWLSAGFGLAAYPLFWWSAPLLRLLGQDAHLAALAQDYLRIAGLGLAPMLVVMTLKSVLAALERGQVALWVTLAAVGVNAGLNYVLIFGRWGVPELGLAGAAIGSVVVQVASLAVIALIAARDPRLRGAGLFRRIWRPDRAALVQVWRLGWPIGLTGLAEVGLFQASALMMGWVGTRELAAHGITLQATEIAFMVHLGLSNAATVRIGQADAQGDARALRDTAKVAMGLSVLFGAGVIVLYLAAPGLVVGAFVGPDDPQAPAILAHGRDFLRIAALFQLMDAAQVMALGFLRGIRDTRRPMLLASLSYWGVGIPAGYLLAFPAGLGGIGLWLGLLAGLTLAGTLLLTRFWRRAPR
ncbi:MATE family efflux transporter [Ruixingdingia sedimenti]|uniref:Multidrug-efflux transporter n=1 Tax=Ruixingdingia sedimenti TaxID=3073604 RepID=A0ABU1FE58_9RHOB|nr:MATE family efflux transporter [Xinfangfangia sp. LG-4]MDR5655151.1 MATE family efflux transporter [Xinfangfangia sp. LG-4]